MCAVGDSAEAVSVARVALGQWPVGQAVFGVVPAAVAVGTSGGRAAAFAAAATRGVVQGPVSLGCAPPP
eukprot:7476965-Lingulodinium_polyedra.AAC.1